MPVVAAAKQELPPADMLLANRDVLPTTRVSSVEKKAPASHSAARGQLT
jgi:hypothetical protein